MIFRVVLIVLAMAAPVWAQVNIEVAARPIFGTASLEYAGRSFQDLGADKRVRAVEYRISQEIWFISLGLSWVGQANQSGSGTLKEKWLLDGVTFGKDSADDKDNAIDVSGRWSSGRLTIGPRGPITPYGVIDLLTCGLDITGKGEESGSSQKVGSKLITFHREQSFTGLGFGCRYTGGGGGIRYTVDVSGTVAGRGRTTFCDLNIVHGFRTGWAIGFLGGGYRHQDIRGEDLGIRMNAGYVEGGILF